MNAALRPRSPQTTSDREKSPRSPQTTSDREKNYIPTLDGLRAVAITGVIVSHAIESTNHPLFGSLGPVGVLIFFAISGYLITTRLVEENGSRGGVSLRNFYVRRVFRILPPALSFLAIVWLLAKTGLLACDTKAIKSAALLYINYTRVDDLGWRVGHFWSLSVEEHFYLIWPALLVGFGVRRGAWSALGGALVICAWRIVDNHFHLIDSMFPGRGLEAHPYRTDLIADALMWGCCLAFVVGNQPRRVIGPLASTIVATSSLGLLLFLVVKQVNHATFVVHLLPAIGVGAIVMSPTAPIGRLLELRAVRLVGRLSYSLYIWQQLFLGGPGPHLPLPLALLGVIACAAASYTIIERPSIRFGRRFIDRRPRPITATVAET